MQILGFTKAMKNKVPKDVQMLFLPMNGKKKKDFTSFCQPTQPIACANHANHVQVIMKSRQSTT